MTAYEEQVARLYALAVLDGYRVEDPDRTDEDET